MEELSNAAQNELDRRRVVRSGGRVSQTLTGRTIRHYATLGLIDKPLRYEGGVARYGDRHLLQLMAVRALQSQFIPLPEIQRRLYGRTDDELKQVVQAATEAAEAAEPEPPTMRSWLVTPILPGLRLLADDRDACFDWLNNHTDDEAVERFRDALGVLRATGRLPVR